MFKAISLGNGIDIKNIYNESLHLNKMEINGKISFNKCIILIEINIHKLRSIFSRTSDQANANCYKPSVNKLT